MVLGAQTFLDTSQEHPHVIRTDLTTLHHRGGLYRRDPRLRQRPSHTQERSRASLLHRHAHQAHRGDLPGERLLRPLLRHLPGGHEPAGEPAFHARRDTPTVNGLGDPLLNHNLNSANPARIDRSQPLTCDQDHVYGAEQKAFDGGLMDKFVEFTDVESCSAPDISLPGLVMDYYDGNTVTAIWNYAQNFALSDNSFGTTFGPSTPGALNLISGQTHGASASASFNVANGTVIGDPNPALDDCSSPSANNITVSGQNIGDLLNAKGISWGWFQGGFRPTAVNSGVAVCGAKTANVGGAMITDYSPHHQPFQYYVSTSNPHHLVPSSTAAIAPPPTRPTTSMTAGLLGSGRQRQPASREFPEGQGSPGRARGLLGSPG